MIQEIIERAGQYYTGFINLPIEGQVIGGVGLIVVLAALKTVWGMLYPVRWTAASLLRIAAFLVHPRKRGLNKAPNKRAVDVPFDVSTDKRFIATVKSYKGKLARNLSDEQLNLLMATAKIYGWATHRGYESGIGLMKHVVAEHGRRIEEEKVCEQARRATKLQEAAKAICNDMAKSAPEKVPFVASEADVV